MSNIVGEFNMKQFTAVIEKCPDTGLYVGYVPGFPGAHSQAESLGELHENLKEVIEMMMEYLRSFYGRLLLTSI